MLATFFIGNSIFFLGRERGLSLHIQPANSSYSTDAVILLVSCWSLGVILEVCHLKLRAIKITSALYDVCSALLATGSVNSKGQQNCGLWSSIQKLWGRSVLFYFSFIFFRNWEDSHLSFALVSNLQTVWLGSCWSSLQDIILSAVTNCRACTDCFSWLQCKYIVSP